MLDLLPNDIFDGATPMPSASHGHDNVPAFSLKVAIGTKSRNYDTQGISYISPPRCQMKPKTKLNSWTFHLECVFSPAIQVTLATQSGDGF